MLGADLALVTVVDHRGGDPPLKGVTWAPI